MTELFTNRTEQLRDIELDLEAWEKLYYKHQQDYIRKRLLAIKYLNEGKSRSQVCSLICCTYNTLTSWIDKYIDEGLSGLVKPIKHKNKPQRLSPEQKQELKKIILEQSPRDYDISRNIWTGEIIIEVIQKKWNIPFKSSRIYEILDELGLSYQRAHRDYANADKAAQKEFVNILKKKLESKGEKEKILFFDEFAVYDRPSLFYGWAEVNTRPEVPSDERKKRNKVNGFLSVDAISGQEYLILSPDSESKDVASYMALLCGDMVQEGYEKLSIFLDRNPTHKDKMKKLLNCLLSTLRLDEKITIEFIPIAAYSPKLNLAEYLIHQLRLKLLHHLPLRKTIADIEKEIENYLKNGQLQTPQQIQNTIGHIYKLATQS